MSKHEHKVAFYDDGDGYCRLTENFLVDRQWEWSGDGERFNYCPECGEPLGEYWRQVDAERAAYRKAQDEAEERGKERNRRKREADRAYADSAPWLDSDLG